MEGVEEVRGKGGEERRKRGDGKGTHGQQKKVDSSISWMT